MPEATDTKDGGAPSGTAAAAAPTTQQAAAGAPAGGTGGASGGASKDDGGKGDGGKAEGGEGEGDPKTVTIGDDEYPVDAKGFLSISVQTFKRRLNRYSAKQLKDTFGTDNVDDIKSRLDEHGKLKAQSEEQRRKQLANTLENALGWNRERVESLGRAANIDLRRRGETLTLEEYGRLARIADAVAGGRA